MNHHILTMGPGLQPSYVATNKAGLFHTTTMRVIYWVNQLETNYVVRKQDFEEELQGGLPLEWITGNFLSVCCAGMKLSRNLYE